jgi:hypothetical protein
LRNQQYDNWEAWLLGEEERQDGKINFIKADATAKEEKLLEASKRLYAIADKPDFIIRIDDDDLVPSYLLRDIANLNFDCYADKYHFVYELESGRSMLRKNPWLASTVVMSYNHAVKRMEKWGGKPLFACDHSLAFEPYFRNKNIIFAPAGKPVYYRVLSPSSQSVTSKSHGATSDPYHFYVKGLGRWNYFPVKGFPVFANELRKLAQIHLGSTPKAGGGTLAMWYNLLLNTLSLRLNSSG